MQHPSRVTVLQLQLSKNQKSAGRGRHETAPTTCTTAAFRSDTSNSARACPAGAYAD